MQVHIYAFGVYAKRLNIHKHSWTTAWRPHFFFCNAQSTHSTKVWCTRIFRLCYTWVRRKFSSSHSVYYIHVCIPVASTLVVVLLSSSSSSSSSLQSGQRLVCTQVKVVSIRYVAIYFHCIVWNKTYPSVFVSLTGSTTSLTALRIFYC